MKGMGERIEHLHLHLKTCAEPLLKQVFALKFSLTDSTAAKAHQFLLQLLFWHL
jgi:hypothetical protein